jgi:hypothetical protein
MRSSSSIIARARSGSAASTPRMSFSGMKRSSCRRLMSFTRSTSSGRYQAMLREVRTIASSPPSRPSRR